LKSLVLARKGKLKKIIIPILVFVLLKAMTLVPLAIGVLGLKAWNALQLSFFSFVISVALAVFQLCKKIAADASTPQPHYSYDAYNAHYARGFASGVVAAADGAQDMAYNAHKQE
jgi:ABC-type nickel/cobalt efflux system permease component RcnA